MENMATEMVSIKNGIYEYFFNPSNTKGFHIVSQSEYLSGSPGINNIVNFLLLLTLLLFILMIIIAVPVLMKIQDDVDPAFRSSYLDTPRKMCEYGATYGIIGFNPLDTLYADHMAPQLYDAFKEKVGYRLRPSIIWKVHRPEGMTLALGMVNDGCANPPGDIIIQAESNNNTSNVCVNGGCFSDRMHIVELPLPKNHDDVIKLTMKIAIRNKIRPVRFAVNNRSANAPYELMVSMKHYKN